jgi:hypothetical protein
MKSKLIASLGVVAGLLGAAGAAEAHVSWSVGINLPGIVAPAPVYYPPPQVLYPAPQVVYPGPVYSPPPAFVYQPQPVYVQPAPVYGGYWREGRRDWDHRREWRDRDDDRRWRH